MAASDAQSPGQFTYATGFKNKPNSQGTLFKARPPSQYAKAAKHPRGYSPERMFDVEDALQGRVSNGGVLDNQLIGHAREGRAQPGATSVVHHAAESQLKRTLARSTAPIEDIRNVTHWNVNVGLGRAVGQFNTSREITGRTPGQPAQMAERREIDMVPGHSSTGTPIHEAGHARSYADKNPSSGGGHSGARGEEEGYADNYMLEHARLPGYKSRRLPERVEDPGTTGKNWGYFPGNPMAQSNFEHSYTGEREKSEHTTLQPQQFERHDAPQQPLVHALRDKDPKKTEFIPNMYALP